MYRLLSKKSLSDSLPVRHFRVFAEDAEQAFISTLQNIIGHAVVKIGPKTVVRRTVVRKLGGTDSGPDLSDWVRRGARSVR